MYEARVWDKQLQGASRMGRERFLGSHASKLHARLLIVVMTEIVAASHQRRAPQVCFILLPDVAAGCSMAHRR